MPVSIEVAKHVTCYVWRCGRPLRDPVTGKQKGARGMCWKHLKQAQRAGDLLPASEVEKPLVICRLCGRPAMRYPVARLCTKHYVQENRQSSPQREDRLARDRERKRKAPGSK
jgi:hypothetical protein